MDIVLFKRLLNETYKILFITSFQRIHAVYEDYEHDECLKI